MRECSRKMKIETTVHERNRRQRKLRVRECRYNNKHRKAGLDYLLHHVKEKMEKGKKINTKINMKAVVTRAGRDRSNLVFGMQIKVR